MKNLQSLLFKLPLVCCGFILVEPITGLVSATQPETTIAAENLNKNEKQKLTKQQSILKEFADGFVKITPGQDKFPELKAVMPKADGKNFGDYAIHKYEVTQELYQLVMGNNPSRWKGPRNSVEEISWHDANVFCKKVTALLQREELISKMQTVTLPMETEWEYACRAGTKTAYSFGDKPTKDGDTGKKAGILDDFAWHTGNAAGNDPPVGALKPNPWGLFDVHGYLWEFTTKNATGNNVAIKDRTSELVQPEGKDWCVVRGGSWKDHYRLLTSDSTRRIKVDAKDDAIGFRCVLRTGD